MDSEGKETVSIQEIKELTMMDRKTKEIMREKLRSLNMEQLTMIKEFLKKKIDEDKDANRKQGVSQEIRKGLEVDLKIRFDEGDREENDGNRTLKTGYWKQETGYRMLETGCWEQDTGNRKLKAGNWMMEEDCVDGRRRLMETVKQDLKKIICVETSSSRRPGFLGEQEFQKDRMFGRIEVLGDQDFQENRSSRRQGVP